MSRRAGSETILVAAAPCPERDVLVRMLEVRGYYVRTADDAVGADRLAEGVDLRIVVGDELFEELGRPASLLALRLPVAAGYLERRVRSVLEGRPG